MNRVLAGCLAFGMFSVVAAQSSAPEKIYSRQKAFRIPFQIPGPNDERQLQEVQLYVARDGTRWEKYTTATPDTPPDKRHFTFRAEQDGEYWFAVRTLDRRGALNPPSDADLQAGLRVVVDSEIPRVRLRPMSRSGRDVGVEWELQDRNLDLNTLRVEYRIEGQDTWRAAPGVAPKVVGYVTWVPETTGKIFLRAQVQDRAQNLGIYAAEIEADAVAARSLPSFSDRPSDATARPPFAEETPRAFVETRDPISHGTPPNGMGARDRDPASAGGPALAQNTAPTAFREPTPTREPAPVVDPAIPANFGPRAAPTPAGMLPANRQILRDTTLSLNYELEGVGSSGVGGVELFITTDMGRTWQLYGPDSDAQPPFVVELAKEGVYGMTLVARSGVGLGDLAPQPGDTPQMWVEVDRSPPQARLLSVEPGRSNEAGTLVVNWQAADSNLTDRPVSLYYADATGEWRTVVAGIENTGRYVWALPASTPPRFRVRMEVVDYAGNRQVVESAEIAVDTSRPKARMIGIAPANAIRR